MRLRILFGSFVLVLGLIVYAGAAMAVVVRLPENALVVFCFYAFAGLAWILPASLVTRWILRAPPYRPPPTA